jgi:hypothetical protein
MQRSGLEKALWRQRHLQGTTVTMRLGLLPALGGRKTLYPHLFHVRRTIFQSLAAFRALVKIPPAA